MQREDPYKVLLLDVSKLAWWWLDLVYFLRGVLLLVAIPTVCYFVWGGPGSVLFIY
jgi:hypothetical protein